MEPSGFMDRFWGFALRRTVRRLWIHGRNGGRGAMRPLVDDIQQRRDPGSLGMMIILGLDIDTKAAATSSVDHRQGSAVPVPGHRRDPDERSAWKCR